MVILDSFLRQVAPRIDCRNKKRDVNAMKIPFTLYVEFSTTISCVNLGGITVSLQLSLLVFFFLMGLSSLITVILII